MDFNDTPAEAAFRAEARAWFEANARPRRSDAPPGLFDERESEDLVAASRAWQGRKAAAGFGAIIWPKEHGGRGGRLVEQSIWDQEEAGYDTPPNIFSVSLGMVGPTIATHGTPDQKARHLRAMLTGAQLFCQLFSEPGAGSDLAGIATRARPGNGGWVVDGQKVWTSRAHQSEFGLLLARTDPSVPKHRGLTAFILDMGAPGVDVRPIRQITGVAKFNEVFLTGVEISDGDRLGGVGDGWRVALTTLMHERLFVGARGEVDAAYALVALCELVRRARVGGRPALDHGSVRRRLAGFAVRVRGLTYTAYRTLTALSREEEPGPEGSVAKLLYARLMQEMAAFALELLGPAGAVRDPQSDRPVVDWPTVYLKAAGMRVAGGTDEIQRTVIGERVLRLPPEPRLDKDLAFSEVPR